MTPDDKRLEEDRQIARGQRAATLMGDALMKEAFKSVEDSLMQAWARSGPRDTADRESYYLELRLLHRLENHLLSVASTGRSIEKSRLLRDPNRVQQLFRR